MQVQKNFRAAVVSLSFHCCVILVGTLTKTEIFVISESRLLIWTDSRNWFG